MLLGSVHYEAFRDLFQLARTCTTEDDAIATLFGDDDERASVAPWMRLDVRLAVRAHYGTKLPMPDLRTFRAWERELDVSLESSFPRAEIADHNSTPRDRPRRLRAACA